MKQLDKTNSLFEVLKGLEVAEANVVELELLWKDICQMVQGNLAFGSNPKYKELCGSYSFTLQYLTEVNGWRPSARPIEFDTTAQCNPDALKLDEISQTGERDTEMNTPGAELKEYRILLNRKRKQVMGEAAFNLIASVDSLIDHMLQELIYSQDVGIIQDISNDKWEKLDEYISQIDMLFGSVERPLLWNDLIYHVRLAQYQNANVIAGRVWPVMRLLIADAMR